MLQKHERHENLPSIVELANKEGQVFKQDSLFGHRTNSNEEKPGLLLTVPQNMNHSEVVLSPCF